MRAFGNIIIKWNQQYCPLFDDEVMTQPITPPATPQPQIAHDDDAILVKDLADSKICVNYVKL